MQRDYRLIEIPYIRIDEAADLLARAMAEDRIVAHLIPEQTKDRYAMLKALFRTACLEKLFASQPILGIEWDNKIVALALVVGTYTPTPSESLKRDRIKLAEVVGEKVMARLEEYRTLKKSHLPPRLHYYLQTLAVDPTFQRMGFGTVLLEHLYERALDDRTTAGIMLDTDAERNQVFYERNGYTASSTAKLGGVKVAFMYRAVR
ncbi:MAG TPA: GNAT family N-acetyltransferase [Fimbriimonadaceae bacterium]|nr:GNAT family N-acetyltransferase [Fimbriimonadaceae bacterium]